MILAWMLDHIQYKISESNYGSEFNGYGAISGVIRGMSYAPMQYRVLIPWLYWPFRRWHTVSYEILKIAFMTLSLWFFWYYCNTLWGQGYMGMFIYALLLLPQFQFDYVEQYVEVTIWIMFILSIHTGNFWISIVAVFVGGLARETTIFLPLLYFLATMRVWPSLILMIVLGTSLLIPRILYGLKESYLKKRVLIPGDRGRFQGKNHLPKNLSDLWSGFGKGLHYSLFSLVYVLLSGLACWINPLPWHYAVYIVIPFIGLWFCRAMFYETRVGMPLLIFIVPAILEVL